MTYQEAAAIEPRIPAIMDGIRPAHGKRARWKQYEAVKAKLSHVIAWSDTISEREYPAVYACAVQEAARRLGL